MSQPITKNSLPVLPQIQINTPCHADWDAMDGDTQKRFCGSCEKHVHNLSELDAKSASELLAKNDGKVCVRIRRNTDGSVVTKDNDLSRRGWLSKFGATAAGLTSMLLFGGCRDPFARQGEIDPGQMGDAVMLGEQCPSAVPKQQEFEMGDFCPEPINHQDAAGNADDLANALTENTWKLTSPRFAFELESTDQYQLLPFAKQQAEFRANWGSFVEFKEGKFEAYNSTQCGNDVSVSVSGTYEIVGNNRIKVFVEHIERNEYCTKPSESPKKSYGIYSLSQTEDGLLLITKD